MRGFRVIVPAGIALAALAGTALAAHPSAHRMTIALPGGGAAVIDYQGDVAPQVRIAPAPGYGPAAFADDPGFPGFGWLGDFSALDRQFDAMLRQANALAAAPVASGTAPQASVVSFGAMPPGASSYSMVSVTTPKGTCVKTVETRSMGPGKPPSTTVRSSGNCDSAAAAPVPAPSPSPRGSAAPAPVDDSRPVSHT